MKKDIRHYDKDGNWHGEQINYYVHTDRISLIDSKLNIRKNYLGSKADIKEIVQDINSLN